MEYVRRATCTFARLRVSVLFFVGNALIITITKQDSVCAFRVAYGNGFFNAKEGANHHRWLCCTHRATFGTQPSPPRSLGYIGAFMAIGIGKMSYGGLGKITYLILQY